MSNAKQISKFVNLFNKSAFHQTKSHLVICLLHVGECETIYSYGAKRFFAILAKLKMIKHFIWPTAEISNKTIATKKWAIRLFLTWKLSLLWFFRIDDLTIQQYKKYLAFFCRKKTQCNFYIVRLYVISAIIDLVLFLKSHYFLKHERINMYALLGQNGNTDGIL